MVLIPGAVQDTQVDTGADGTGLEAVVVIASRAGFNV